MAGTGYGRVQRINPEYFTGKTRLAELSSAREGKVFHVDFFRGARTKLHAHTGAQLLIVTGGRGSLVVFKKTGRGSTRFGIAKKGTVRLKKGSVAYIPPKTLHTHGSTGTGTFSHIAINYAARAGSKTIWYESDHTRVTGVLK